MMPVNNFQTDFDNVDENWYFLVSEVCWELRWQAKYHGKYRFCVLLLCASPGSKWHLYRSWVPGGFSGGKCSRCV